MAEKTVAFLVARLSSSRMAGKHFRHIGDKPMINWIIDQLKMCHEIDEIVVTTVSEHGNKPLQELAVKEHISCFWYEGEIDHVTTRLCKAAAHHKADICLLISGDCPLIYGPAIDILLKSFKKDRKSNVLQINAKNSLPPALYGVEIARRNAWDLAEELSDKPELKEHHFPAIGMNKERFVMHESSLPENLYAPLQRLFVDTWADFEFLNTIHDILAKCNKSFSLPNVLNVLETQPELQTINQHVHQRRLKEDIKQILFIIDAGGSFGYGHLMRSLELGLQVVERLSWPVTFVVDDPFAKQLIEEKGLKVLSAAFHRKTQKSVEKNFDWNVVNTFDLVVLDLADRSIPKEWRSHTMLDIPVLVMDKMQKWCDSADLIVIPGVTASKQQLNDWHDSHQNGPKVLSGMEYLIIRRAIRNAAPSVQIKEFDLLLYLHDEKKQEIIKQSGIRHGLSVCTVQGDSRDFPTLLAKSRYYMGGFGYTFYEALFLNVFPIALSGSNSHEIDAKRFYTAFDLPPFIFDPNKDFTEQWNCISSEHICMDEYSVKDGTPVLVNNLKKCIKIQQII